MLVDACLFHDFAHDQRKDTDLLEAENRLDSLPAHQSSSLPRFMMVQTTTTPAFWIALAAEQRFSDLDYISRSIWDDRDWDTELQLLMRSWRSCSPG